MDSLVREDLVSVVIFSHMDNLPGDQLDEYVNSFVSIMQKWAVVLYSTSPLDMDHDNPNVYYLKHGVSYSEKDVGVFEHRIRRFVEDFDISDRPNFELLEPRLPTALLAYYCCKRGGMESCKLSDAANIELKELDLDQSLLDGDDVEPLREALLHTLSDRITSWP